MKVKMRFSYLWKTPVKYVSSKMCLLDEMLVFSGMPIAETFQKSKGGSIANNS